MNVLEILRKVKFVKSAIIITSDKCYKNYEKRPNCEDQVPSQKFRYWLFRGKYEPEKILANLRNFGFLQKFANELNSKENKEKFEFRIRPSLFDPEIQY